MLTALRADAHLPSARLKSRKYMSSSLLLVDEMGYDPMSREEASLFFRLVSYRLRDLEDTYTDDQKFSAGDTGRVK